MGSRHADLRAYQLAASLADQIAADVARFPSHERWSIGIQLVRSCGSIGANIAEGFGRGTASDIRRFLIMARGSLLETEHWCERATAHGLLESDAYSDALAELGKVLNGLIKSKRLR